jgi:pilus assembly protein Flp/PilA
MRMSEGSVAVRDLLMRAALSVQGAYGTLLDRALSEQGVSMVQYALLVALIALVVVLMVGLLGSGIKGLFGSAHDCMNGLTTTACRVGPMARATVRVKGP